MCPLSSVLPAVDHGGERFPLERPDPQGETQTVLPIYIGSGLVIGRQTGERRQERPDFNYNLHIASSLHILFWKLIIFSLRNRRFSFKFSIKP